MEVLLPLPAPKNEYVIHLSPAHPLPNYGPERRYARPTANAKYRSDQGCRNLGKAAPRDPTVPNNVPRN